MPNRAVAWEMFENGAGLRPMQGSARDEEDPVENHKMLVVRYVGEDREEVLGRLDEVIRLWHKHRTNFAFPKMWKLAGPRMLGWYAREPDALAKGYARKARAGRRTKARCPFPHIQT